MRAFHQATGKFDVYVCTYDVTKMGEGKIGREGYIKMNVLHHFDVALKGK
jgi:hypothetical protein